MTTCLFLEMRTAGIMRSDDSGYYMTSYQHHCVLWFMLKCATKALQPKFTGYFKRYAFIQSILCTPSHYGLLKSYKLSDWNDILIYSIKRNYPLEIKENYTRQRTVANTAVIIVVAQVKSQGCCCVLTEKGLICSFRVICYLGSISSRSATT